MSDTIEQDWRHRKFSLRCNTSEEVELLTEAQRRQSDRLTYVQTKELLQAHRTEKFKQKIEKL